MLIIKDIHMNKCEMKISIALDNVTGNIEDYVTLRAKEVATEKGWEWKDCDVYVKVNCSNVYTKQSGDMTLGSVS